MRSRVQLSGFGTFQWKWSVFKGLMMIFGHNRIQKFLQVNFMLLLTRCSILILNLRIPSKRILSYEEVREIHNKDSKFSEVPGVKIEIKLLFENNYVNFMSLDIPQVEFGTTYSLWEQECQLYIPSPPDCTYQESRNKLVFTCEI